MLRLSYDGEQVRIQLGQGSAAEVTKTMLKNEGFGAFYKVCSCEIYLYVAMVDD